MRMFWIFGLAMYVCVWTTILSMVSHFSGFTLNGNFERYFIFDGHKAKSSSNYLPYRKTLQIWWKKLDFEFLSWVRGRLGVYLSLVRWGRCQMTKECHSHRHRCWLFWTPLGNMRSCCNCSRWRNQMFLRITIIYSIYLFDLHWIQSTPVSSVFTISNRHIHFKLQEARCRIFTAGESEKLSSCSKR